MRSGAGVLRAFVHPAPSKVVLSRQTVSAPHGAIGSRLTVAAAPPARYPFALGPCDRHLATAATPAAEAAPGTAAAKAAVTPAAQLPGLPFNKLTVGVPKEIVPGEK
jgi:hypothetical protein